MSVIRRVTPEALIALGELAGVHGGFVQQPNVLEDGSILTCLWDGLLPHSRVVLYVGVTPSGATVTGEDVLVVLRDVAHLAADELADRAVALVNGKEEQVAPVVQLPVRHVVTPT